MLTENRWPCGATDKASDYESGDSRFESLARSYLFCLILRETLYIIFTAINADRTPVALWRNG